MDAIKEQKMELKESLSEYLPNFINGTNQVVVMLQQGKSVVAYENIVTMIDGLEWILAAIPHLADFSDLNFDEDKVNQVLRELSEGLNHMDTVLISDLLEYELLPIVNELHQSLERKH